MLQRAVLVNSVSCREAMLLGRIMEEAEEAIYVILSLSLSLLFLFYCTLMFCPSFLFLSLTVTLLVSLSCDTWPNL